MSTNRIINKYDGQKKKYALFRVYEILSEYTDENHHLTQKEILRLIYERYGLTVERKLIRECIDDINELGASYGIEVSCEKGDGAYMIGRRLDRREISFLIDAVFSCRSIDQKQAVFLTEKLQKFLSKYDKKCFSYISKCGEVTRTNNKFVMYNIDLLLDSISQGKKIQFNYSRYYLNTIKNEKLKNRLIVASPYYLVNNQGKYYLVCNNDYFDDIANYRVENISNIEILDIDVKPIKSLKGCENGFDITKYSNDNIYIFSTNSIDAKIKIDNEYTISYVLDWFGNNAKISQDNQSGTIYAYVHANEQALIYWCLQYGETIELLEPIKTREKIKQIVVNMAKKYK